MDNTFLEVILLGQVELRNDFLGLWQHEATAIARRHMDMIVTIAVGWIQSDPSEFTTTGLSK
jgi:hypothetical protein